MECVYLNVYVSIEKYFLSEVIKLSKNTKDRYPFFMSMYAFEDKFQGVKEYISHYLVGISKNDRKTLEYISLVDWFANKTLDVSFLNLYDDTVIGSDSAGNYLKVKLCEYRNAIGSIHSNELPEGKTVFDYKHQDIIYGKIIGEKFVEKEGRIYYQIRLKTEEMTDWQRKLSEYGKK